LKRRENQDRPKKMREKSMISLVVKNIGAAVGPWPIGKE
jgi:hypothetical protein